MAIGIYEINSIQLMGMWDFYMGNGKSWDNWDIIFIGNDWRCYFIQIITMENLRDK
jgi:hypothetical protein